MRAVLIAVLSLAALSLASCGQRVEIETAHVGRVMTTSGLENTVRSPSTFRLPVNFLGNNPSRLIVIETSDQQKKETMEVFMPKDDLILTFEVRGTFSIPSTQEGTAAIFDRVVPEAVGENPYIYRVDFDQVYEIYAQREIWITSREVVTNYDIPYVMAHLEDISRELREKIGERLKATPIRVIEFNLSKTLPPDVILEAEAVAKQRQVQIQEAKADRLVKITEAEAKLAVAKKQQMIDLIQADTNRQVGLKLTRGVNPNFVQQRTLNILDGLNDNRVILVPEEALQNPAMMMAVNQQMLRGSPSKSSND